MKQQWSLRHPASNEPSTEEQGSFSKESRHPHVVCYIHGHSHASWGISQFGDVPVINPGALKYGRFAELILEQCMDDDGKTRWNVQSVCFHQLPRHCYLSE